MNHDTRAITAVGFDLWETLITNSHEASQRQSEIRVERLQEALIASGVARSHAAVELAHAEVWQRCHDLYWSRDVDIPTQQQLIHFFDLLDVDVPDSRIQQFESAYAESILDHPPDLVDDAVELLELLTKRHYRLGLISNTGRTPGAVLRELLRRIGLAPFIEVMVFSNEQGICKPDPSIFAALSEGLRAEPSQIAFVGDNRDVDVYGAWSAGMIAIHLLRDNRGTAFAPDSGRGRECEPYATITTLLQLPAVLERGLRTGVLSAEC